MTDGERHVQPSESSIQTREERSPRRSRAVQTLPPATTVQCCCCSVSYDAERSRACRGPIRSQASTLTAAATARLLEIVTKATLLIIIIRPTIRLASGTRLPLFTQSRLARFNVCTTRTASVKPWDQYSTMYLYYMAYSIHPRYDTIEEFNVDSKAVYTA